MNPRARQTGISFIGVIFLLIAIGIVVLLGLKLFPVYMESFKIDTGLKSLIQNPKVDKMTNQEMISSLIKRFDIDDVESINYQNIKRHITIKRENGTITIVCNYQARAPLFGNLTLLADFHKVVHN